MVAGPRSTWLVSGTTTGAWASIAATTLSKDLVVRASFRVRLKVISDHIGHLLSERDGQSSTGPRVYEGSIAKSEYVGHEGWTCIGMLDGKVQGVRNIESLVEDRLSLFSSRGDAIRNRGLSSDCHVGAGACCSRRNSTVFLGVRHPHL